MALSAAKAVLTLDIIATVCLVSRLLDIGGQFRALSILLDRTWRAALLILIRRDGLISRYQGSLARSARKSVMVDVLPGVNLANKSFVPS